MDPAEKKAARKAKAGGGKAKTPAAKAKRAADAKPKVPLKELEELREGLRALSSISAEETMELRARLRIIERRLDALEQRPSRTREGGRGADPTSLDSRASPREVKARSTAEELAKVRDSKRGTPRGGRGGGTAARG